MAQKHLNDPYREVGMDQPAITKRRGRPLGSKNSNPKNLQSYTEKLPQIFPPPKLLPPLNQVPRSFSEGGKANPFLTCPTVIFPLEPPRLLDVLDAIEHCEGNIYEMSLLLKRKRGVLKTFIEAHVETMDAMSEAKEIIVDKAERKLFDNAIIECDPTSLRYILSTLGKDRGYAAKVEHTGADNKPLQFEVTLAEPSQTALGKLNDKQVQERFLDDLLKSGVDMGEKSDN